MFYHQYNQQKPKKHCKSSKFKIQNSKFKIQNSNIKVEIWLTTPNVFNIPMREIKNEDDSLSAEPKLIAWSGK